MTVQELIDELQEIENKSLPVIFQNSYGTTDTDDEIIWEFGTEQTSDYTKDVIEIKPSYMSYL